MLTTAHPFALSTEIWHNHASVNQLSDQVWIDGRQTV
jgi:hypothetical protein